MKSIRNVYSSKNDRVERNAKLFSVSLRFDKGSNYFFVSNTSSYFLYNTYMGITEADGNLVAYVIMPNHAHIIAETLSYEVLAKVFQTNHAGFSKYLRAKMPNNFGKRRIFARGPRYHAIHDMRQLFNCLKYFYDNPTKWNENPLKEKMKDTSENYYGSVTSEILKGTSKCFNAEVLKHYTGFSDLNNLLALLRLPKSEFQKEVELVLKKRDWNEEKDNRVFKIDPSKPWTNPWDPEEVCYEAVTEGIYNPKPVLEELKTFVDI